MASMFSVSAVGGRPVVASGAVVLSPRDTDAAITLENLTFQISFVPQDGDVALRTEIPQPATMNFVVLGHVQSLIGGVAWDLPSIATFHGKALHLMLHVSAVGDDAPVRTVNFTFSSDNA